MRTALDKAREGVRLGQSPFGAAIVSDDQLIVAAHNIVLQATDITAHGEVTAIREACRLLHRIDLSDCTIYSTCEPCPMCFTACHWAGIRRIVYGTGIPDAIAAGFKELPVSNANLKRLGHSPIEIVPGVLLRECQQLFNEWAASPDARTY
jgi:tRNA(Arg) A34 adenosine deaminase TadA